MGKPNDYDDPTQICIEQKLENLVNIQAVDIFAPLIIFVYILLIKSVYIFIRYT